MFKNYSRKHDMKSLKQTKRFRINLEDTEITKTNKISQNYCRRDKIIDQSKIFWNKFGGFRNHWNKQNISELIGRILKSLKQIKFFSIDLEEIKIMKINKKFSNEFRKIKIKTNKIFQN